MEPAAAVPDIAYNREMGLTHDDFWRLLPRAMGECEFQISGNTVNAQVGCGALTIEIGAAQERRIALLRLPFSVVSFAFVGVTVEQQQAFKKHFDLYFQRGGG